MKPPPDHLLSVMAEAAALRAAGDGWESVAAKVGRSAYTCRRWPVRYPRQWDRLFRRAARRLLGDVSGEALFYLRRLLRGEPNKLGQDTAKFLYAKQLERLDRPGRRKRTAAPSIPERPQSEREQLMAWLARTSEEEFDKLMQQVNDWHAARFGDEPGAATTPLIGVDPSGHGEPTPSSGAETS